VARKTVFKKVEKTMTIGLFLVALTSLIYLVSRGIHDQMNAGKKLRKSTQKPLIRTSFMDTVAILMLIWSGYNLIVLILVS